MPRWCRILGEYFALAAAGPTYAMLFVVPQFGRWIKLQVACLGLESDQVEMVCRLERRLSPYHAEFVRLSLHEMFAEARMYYDIAPWRIRLIM